MPSQLEDRLNLPLNLHPQINDFLYFRHTRESTQYLSFILNTTEASDSEMACMTQTQYLTERAEKRISLIDNDGRLFSFV